MASKRPDIHARLANAAKAGKLDRVREMLAKGARPDVGEYTALVGAIEGDSVEIMACLIEVQPAQEALDYALRIAVNAVHEKQVQMLLDAGARVTFDAHAKDLFLVPRLFGINGSPAGVRRILIAHKTAAQLQDAMGDGAVQTKSAAGGMQPL